MKDLSEKGKRMIFLKDDDLMKKGERRIGS